LAAPDSIHGLPLSPSTSADTRPAEQSVLFSGKSGLGPIQRS
jgi:hypothetical protein